LIKKINNTIILTNFLLMSAWEGSFKILFYCTETGSRNYWLWYRHCPNIIWLCSRTWRQHTKLDWITKEGYCGAVTT